MARPLILDLFCGAGGAAMGYYLAGFDVIGVDAAPQPRYPFRFVQMDALAFLGVADFRRFAAIHASPPCHDHSSLSAFRGKDGTGHLLAETRDRLQVTGLPYVIENVVGAPMINPLKLCGSEFGLETMTARGLAVLRRHRLFETDWFAYGAGGCHCAGRLILGVYGSSDGDQSAPDRRGWCGTVEDGRRVMGIDWMNRRELTQAIPPAYTRFVGGQLLDVIK